jgi:aminoglycoside phosphotransferase (APT) family kinase protein
VRAELADGRLVFIKAAGESLNPESPMMHRRESAVLGVLPPIVPAPHLIGFVDDGDWVALLIEWVDGRSPNATDPHDVQRLLNVLHRLADETRGIQIDGIRSVAEAHHELFGHWLHLAADPPPGLDAWSRRHLERLTELDTQTLNATAGGHLVHLDVRTDNVLLATDGPTGDVLVDWPGASLGAPWVDLVSLLPALQLDGGPPPAEVLPTTSLGRHADPDAVDIFVVSLAGYFTHMSLLPAPPGLPTVRAFQAAQGEIARAWAARRLRLR